MLKIGKQLRRLRVERGVTHRQLAQAVGITEGAISRIETDKSEPSAGTMAGIADFLGVTMDALRDDVGASRPHDLEAQLIAAAKRAQEGDPVARAEMKRLAVALAEAESQDAAAEKAPVPARRRKET